MNPSLVLFSGSANLPLAEKIAETLGQRLGRRTLARFPDSELHVEIEETVRNANVYLIQPTGPPADTNLMELLFMADACRRAGAIHLTAIAPYFGYARQDRRASGRDSVGARLVADLIASAGLGRIVAVDLHSAALEGFFSVPLEHLSAVALLANAARDLVDNDGVIVAPDLGAVKLGERYAELLGLPMAIVHKIRLSGTAVKVRQVVGDVRDRKPVIIDDMISTGATIEAAARALLAAGCAPEITVIASHALNVGPANERLAALGVKHLVVTDSVIHCCRRIATSRNQFLNAQLQSIDASCLNLPGVLGPVSVRPRRTRFRPTLIASDAQAESGSAVSRPTPPRRYRMALRLAVGRQRADSHERKTPAQGLGIHRQEVTYREKAEDLLR
jgi:ribose-phosphate pyrophosphokinase